MAKPSAKIEKVLRSSPRARHLVISLLHLIGIVRLHFHARFGFRSQQMGQGEIHATSRLVQRDAAQFLGVSYSTIRKWARSGTAYKQLDRITQDVWLLSAVGHVAGWNG